MTVNVDLKCGKKLVFEGIDNYEVINGLLSLERKNKNIIVFNWNEVVCVSVPDYLDVREYKSTLRGRKC